MKTPVEQLSGRLEAVLGKEAVTSASATTAAYKVDGKSPILLCSPEDEAQISAVLRLCAEARAGVIPWGGGTAIGLGNIPRQADVILELTRLHKLLDHDDANLTASAQAGIRVADLQRLLAERAQFLPLEPPHPDRATIGGTIAANINGPRRLLYGAVRDLVIGMKMVLADGRQIKAGGKVVKNVAGYDMCKLFVGSLGTLGVVTEATFKLAPIPESSATLLAHGSLAPALQLAEQLMQSTLLPAALTLIGAGAAGINSGRSALAIRVEGFEEAVGRHVRESQELARALGLGANLLRGNDHDSLWERLRDFAGSEQNLLFRVSLPIAALAEAIEKIDRWSRSEGGARYVAHVGTGTIWIEAEAAPSGDAWFPRLASLAKERRGHALMAAAPPEFKQERDIWGEVPESLFLMRRIKHQFDPHDILNPGRFLAGL